MSDLEVLDWVGYGEAARALAQQVHDDQYQPDLILGIARGGLFVAASLGYALGVRNLCTMNVMYYTGVDERLAVPLLLPPVPDLVDVAGARVLIADDIADTGHTLLAVKQFCEGRVAEVRVACIYEKPRSVVRCEYVWKAVEQWVEFPWATPNSVVTPGAVRLQP